MNKIFIRKLKSVFTLTAVAAIAFVAPSRADELVDSGTPSGSTWNFLASYQSAAVGFTLTGTETITQVDGYMADNAFKETDGPTFDGNGGTIDVTIVQGSSPSGTAVYSGSFALASDQSAAWLGVSGLDTTLGAGDYWVEFSTKDANAAIFGNAPGQLATKFNSNGTGWVTDSEPTYIGLQLYGDPVAQVPDMGATAGLLALGVAGLLAFNWRRKLVG